jgi:hypothetical protein
MAINISYKKMNNNYYNINTTKSMDNNNNTLCENCKDICHCDQSCAIVKTNPNKLYINPSRLTANDDHFYIDRNVNNKCIIDETDHKICVEKKDEGDYETRTFMVKKPYHYWVKVKKTVNESVPFWRTEYYTEPVSSSYWVGNVMYRSTRNVSRTRQVTDYRLVPYTKEVDECVPFMVDEEEKRNVWIPNIVEKEIEYVAYQSLAECGCVKCNCSMAQQKEREQLKALAELDLSKQKTFQGICGYDCNPDTSFCLNCKHYHNLSKQPNCSWIVDDDNNKCNCSSFLTLRSILPDNQQDRFNRVVNDIVSYAIGTYYETYEKLFKEATKGIDPTHSFMRTSLFIKSVDIKTVYKIITEKPIFNFTTHHLCKITKMNNAVRTVKLTTDDLFKLMYLVSKHKINIDKNDPHSSWWIPMKNVKYDDPLMEKILF